MCLTIFTAKPDGPARRLPEPLLEPPTHGGFKGQSGFAENRKCSAPMPRGGARSASWFSNLQLVVVQSDFAERPLIQFFPVALDGDSNELRSGAHPRFPE